MHREPGQLAVIIPAYRPSAGLVDLVRTLSESASAGGTAIVVVDDGSGPEYQELFSRVAALPGAEVLRHSVNRGKGVALKTAINHVLLGFPEIAGVVTADAAQHDPDDILLVAAALQEHPEFLILGCRKFDRKASFKHRLGNAVTTGAMHALLGQRLSDPHPGLRGIPAAFLPAILRINASGPELELDMLIAAHRRSVPVMEVPIRTIDTPGSASRFNPVLDSMKIYFALLRFGSVSLLSALLDNLVFYLAYHRLGDILIAQILARTISVAFNYVMVRRSVFHSEQSHKTVLPQYLLLVVVSGTASYGGIRFLYEKLGINPVIAKLPVEAFMFFVNFAIQRMFIFKPAAGSIPVPRRTRVLVSALIASGFAGLLALEIYGFWTNHLFTPGIWLPSGLARFIKVGGVYLALAVPLLLFVPWSFAALVSVTLLALTAVSVGLQPVLAVAFFLISSCALGSKLLGRSKTESLTTHLCAMLLGTGVYVFLMTLMARAPVNYAAVWGILLAVPLLADIRGVWRRLRFWAARILSVELRFPSERLSLAFLVFILVAHWLVALLPEISGIL